MADTEQKCVRCGGDGWISFGDTTLGRGGYGGQLITSRLCPDCEGKGFIIIKE